MVWNSNKLVPSVDICQHVHYLRCLKTIVTLVTIGPLLLASHFPPQVPSRIHPIDPISTDHWCVSCWFIPPPHQPQYKMTNWGLIEIPYVAYSFKGW